MPETEQFTFVPMTAVLALGDRQTLPPEADTGLDPGDPSNSLPAIPGYAILGTLGRGGMGVVYKARQVDLDRIVGLKILRSGGGYPAADEARFVTEAEAIARVRHPNVVQVFQAGKHDGIPFLAMEYVDGGSLAEKLKAGPLAPVAAARLVEAVARGVGASHQAGILHRDIKPGNVLLTADGTPKVADFGLAKRLAADSSVTRTGQILGTPCYMPPEQASGVFAGLGPPADVYSLGAVLYECLTGRPPFVGQDVIETIMLVLTLEAVPPRTLLPTVPRDLETICLKCLQKTASKRYATADDLADDLQRFLDGVPILARPTGPVERGAKWVKRNRTLSVAALAVFGALAVGAAVSGWQAVVATQARGTAVAEASNARDAEAKAKEEEAKAKLAEAKAKQEEANARAAEAVAKDREEKERTARLAVEDEKRKLLAVADFLTAVLVQSSPANQSSPGRKIQADLTVKEAMDYAAKTIDGKFPDQPLIEATIRLTIGNTYHQLAKFKEAEAHLKRAVELFRDHAGEKGVSTLIATNDLAEFYRMTEKFAKAIPLFETAIAGFREVLGNLDFRTLGAIGNLGQAYGRLNDLAKAEPLIREAYDGRLKTLGSRDPQTVIALHAVAKLNHAKGDIAKAEEQFKQVVELRKAIHGPEHPHTLNALENLAGLYLSTLNPAAAEAPMRAAYEGRLKVLGERHPDTISAQCGVGVALLQLNRHAEAEPFLRPALKLMEEVYGTDDPNTTAVRLNYAEVLRKAGKLDEARACYRDAITIFERIRGAYHPTTLNAINNLGLLELQGKTPEAAEPYFRDALEGFRKTAGPDHPSTLNVMNNLATFLERTGKLDEAEELLQAVVKGYRKKFGNEHGLSVNAGQNLGYFLLKTKRYAAAEAELTIVAAAKEKAQPGSWQAAEARVTLGFAMLGQPKKAAAAAALFIRCYEELKVLKSQLPAAKKPLIGEAARGIVAAFTLSGDTAKADEWRERVKAE